MNYPLEKYHYYTYRRADGAMVVKAVSTYAGQNIFGKAVCHPNDKFNLEKGKELGFKQGEEIGFKQGEEIGRAKGEADKQREIAKNFKHAGIPIDVIAKNTGLAFEIIETL